jgi:hypothetical protein
VRGHQARVKNADLRHPSRTVVMYKRKSASPILNVLTLGMQCTTTFSLIIYIQVGPKKINKFPLSEEFLPIGNGENTD